MSRPFDPTTLKILTALADKTSAGFLELHKNICPQKTYKEFYNILYRLQADGLIKKSGSQGALKAEITTEGKTLLMRKSPKKDGVWKLVIFDIPEKHKYVRNVLRAKLKSLQFKKWQNSIWVSPFALDKELEEEMKELAKKYFVRLIRATDINEMSDLEKMFKSDFTA